MKEGKDFYLAFVPERIMEGKAIEEEKTLPKIIGCYSDESFKKVSEFFKKVGGGIIRVTNPRTAEFIKLIDNAWRNTRFAFANELAFLAEENEIDVLEAIECANKGYERNQIPIPGPVSGYCLGKDPYILEGAFEKVVKKRGFNSLWYYGRRANDWFYDKIVEEVDGKKILIAGLTFKANIDDFRYSHGIEIIKKLLEKGYELYVHDPYMDKNDYTNLPKNLEKRIKKIYSLADGMKQVDTIIFATPHEEYKNFDLGRIVNARRKLLKIIDLWNIFKELDDELFIYKGFGKVLYKEKFRANGSNKK